MRYWPLSQIAQSELMHWSFAADLYNVTHRGGAGLMGGTILACGRVAVHLPPSEAPQLGIIESKEANFRHVYLGRPGFDEWMRLERAGVLMDTNGDLHLLIDALH